MSTSLHKNIADNMANDLPDASGMRVGIVVSEWNDNITTPLLDGARDTLLKCGVREEDIAVLTVPGSFELIFGASQMTRRNVDAVIAIGCVIRGDTPHFDYICEGATYGLAKLNATQDTPVVYGLITTNNLEQAKERSGGALGNKGEECAITAVKMINYKRAVSLI